MRKLFFALLLVALSAPVALAQSDEYHKGEFHAGYSHMSADLGFLDREWAPGWEASGTGNVSRYVGFTGLVSGNYKSILGFDVNAHQFLGGIQVKDNSKETKVKPFFHALFGVARWSGGGFSETDFAARIGGGLDIRVSKRVDIRAISAAWNPIRGDGETANNFVIGAGIVIH